MRLPAFCFIVVVFLFQAITKGFQINVLLKHSPYDY